MIQAMNLKSIIWPSSGTYILAISGGVDSMVLLDIFSKSSKEKNYNLVVAHFDHKMRKDSEQDAVFVDVAAGSHSLDIEIGTPKSKLLNEATARSARYEFLNQVGMSYDADGIITAHHQDDLLETSLLNLARGSRRVGLAPFASEQPLRPFRNISRKKIIQYAMDQNITWREDPSNADVSNPRNFVRNNLLSLATPKWRQDYLAAIDKMAALNESIDTNLEKRLVQGQKNTGYSFSRSQVASLSIDETAELLLASIRKCAPRTELDQRLIHELVIFAKTAKPGRKRPINKLIELHVDRSTIKIVAHL